MKSEDISDLVYKIVSENFNELNNTDKSILEKFSLKQTLELPYYKDFYNSSYITIEDGEAKLSFFNDDLNSLAREKFNDYNPDFSKSDMIILDENKIKLLKKVIGIFILSSNAKNYFEKLKEYYEENFYFRNNIKDIEPFFNSYETDLLFNDFIKYNDKFKNIKNEEHLFRINESIEREFLDSINFKFENRKERITEDLIKLSKNFIYQKDFIKKYSNDINFIVDQVKVDRPYLNEKPNIENITYELIEINPSKKNREFIDNYFVKEEDSIFKDKVLSKYGITRLSLEKEENSYYSYDDILYSHFKNQPNELNTDKSPVVYGLKYIDNNSFERSEGRCVFLTAKKNDEIVGVIAFSSGENLISGVHNSVVSTIKNNYRGIGLGTELYKKTSNIFNDIGLTFVNTFYTEDGNAKLKHKKSKLNEEFKNCFFIDTDMRSFLNIENGSTLEEFSKRFVFIMNKINDEGNVKGNSHIFKKHYMKNYNKINEDLKNGTLNIFSYEEFIDRIEKIKKDIISEIKKDKKYKHKI